MFETSKFGNGSGQPAGGETVGEQDSQQAAGQVEQVGGAQGKEKLAEFLGQGQSRHPQRGNRRRKTAHLQAARKGARQQVSQDSVQQEVSGQVAAGEAVEGAQEGGNPTRVGGHADKENENEEEESDEFFQCDPTGPPPKFQITEFRGGIGLLHNHEQRIHRYQ